MGPDGDSNNHHYEVLVRNSHPLFLFLTFRLPLSLADWWTFLPWTGLDWTGLGGPSLLTSRSAYPFFPFVFSIIIIIIIIISFNFDA